MSTSFEPSALQSIVEFSFSYRKHTGHKQITVFAVQFDAYHHILIYPFYQFNALSFFRMFSDIIRFLYYIRHMLNQICFSRMMSSNMRFKAARLIYLAAGNVLIGQFIECLYVFAHFNSFIVHTLHLLRSYIGIIPQLYKQINMRTNKKKPPECTRFFL